MVFYVDRFWCVTPYVSWDATWDKVDFILWAKVSNFRVSCLTEYNAPVWKTKSMREKY